MPGSGGKAKAPHEMSMRELIATLIAFTVVAWLIATGCIVTIVQNFSAFTLVFNGAGVVFVASVWLIACWRIIPEMLRRLNGRR